MGIQASSRPSAGQRFLLVAEASVDYREPSRVAPGKAPHGVVPRAKLIADQTFTQGFTTHKNSYDFVTLGTFESMFSTSLQKPPGADFWEWIKTAKFDI